MLYNLPPNHVGGRVFFAFRDRPAVDPDGYFQLIKGIRPLLAADAFTVSTPGFYINYIQDQDVPDGTLRLNYYSVNAPLTIDTIEAFAAASPVLTIVRREHADRSRPLESYDEGRDPAELEFRNFLNANTRVCLDMLANFGEHSFESLVATYRFIYLPQGVPPQEVFEPFFVGRSDAFNDLWEHGNLQRYWNDLIKVHPGSNVGLHFMVNLATLPDAAYSLQWLLTS
jgi:hypothetical protein